MYRFFVGAAAFVLSFCSVQVGVAEVTITYTGETLPVYVVYGDGTKKGQPYFETNVVDGVVLRKFPVKAGNVKIWVRPKYNQSCFMPVQYALNGDTFGEPTISAESFTVKDGDDIFIRILKPIAPWNSIVVEAKGKPVLVGLARPTIDNRELLNWESGDGAGEEEFSSSLFFLAEYGVEKMAVRVAKNYKATGKDRIDHISVIPSVGLELSEEELVEVVTNGLTKIMKQAPAQNLTIYPTIGEEVKKAKDLLAAGRGRKNSKTE